VVLGLDTLVRKDFRPSLSVKDDVPAIRGIVGTYGFDYAEGGGRNNKLQNWTDVKFLFFSSIRNE
jgi:lipoprotein NlpI